MSIVLSEPEAEEKYCKIYKNMIKKFGHKNQTSNSQLDKIGKELFNKRSPDGSFMQKYIGTFAQNALPEKIYEKNNNLYAIINVDTLGMPGTHWVAVAGLPNSTKVMVFDSFGRASKVLLPTLRQKNVIDTDNDAEQRKAQLSCGQFSMAWLLFLERYGFANAKLI